MIDEDMKVVMAEKAVLAKGEASYKSVVGADGYAFRLSSILRSLPKLFAPEEANNNLSEMRIKRNN